MLRLATVIVSVVCLTVGLGGAEFTYAATQDGVTIVVNTQVDELVDNGNCSLREAIQAANTNTLVDACPAGGAEDTIVIPAGNYLLVDTLHLITGTVALRGSAVDATVLDGGGWVRVLQVHDGANVNLSYLTVRNGRVGVTDPGDPSAASGGGILNAGTLVITNCTIADNRAGKIDGGTWIDGAPGGGISSEGTLQIINSTVSHNAAGDAGCGPFTHGGQYQCGDPAQGGGIANSGVLALDSTTIAWNQAGMSASEQQGDPYQGAGGGLTNQGMVRLRNTLIASNGGGDCAGALESQGYNLIENTGGCALTGDLTGVVLGRNAGVNGLAANGGPTLTHALNRWSAAIDAGSCTNSQGQPISEDQRGEPRPQLGTCDIGAYESAIAASYELYWLPGVWQKP